MIGWAESGRQIKTAAQNTRQNEQALSRGDFNTNIPDLHTCKRRLDCIPPTKWPINGRCGRKTGLPESTAVRAAKPGSEKCGGLERRHRREAAFPKSKRSMSGARLPEPETRRCSS